MLNVISRCCLSHCDQRHEDIELYYASLLLFIINLTCRSAVISDRHQVVICAGRCDLEVVVFCPRSVITEVSYFNAQLIWSIIVRYPIDFFISCRQKDLIVISILPQPSLEPHHNTARNQGNLSEKSVLQFCQLNSPNKSKAIEYQSVGLFL